MRYKLETERENLFDVNMTIAMRVRLKETPSSDQLRDVFYKAVRTYEILNSRIIIENDGNAYYVDCDSPASSFNESDLTFEELINANEKIRFKVENGEYIRGFLTPDGIVFLMHHLGGDGKSLLFFIETFMRLLSGENVDKVPFGKLGLSDLPEESKPPYLYELLIRSWNLKWAKERKVFTFEDLDQAFTSFWKEHETITTLTVYDKPELDHMLKESKETGCSLTSYLISDLIKEWTSKSDVGLAVDGRLDNSRLMGNYATGVHVNYRFDKNMSVGKNAGRFNTLLRRTLSNPKVRYNVLHFVGKLDPTLIDAVCLEAAGAYHNRLSSRYAELMSYGKKKRDLSITNLMRADIPTQYGEYEIEDIAFVPPVVSYGRNLYGMITVNDRLIVSHHIYK